MLAQLESVFKEQALPAGRAAVPGAAACQQQRHRRGRGNVRSGCGVRRRMRGGCRILLPGGADWPAGGVASGQGQGQGALCEAGGAAGSAGSGSGALRLAEGQMGCMRRRPPSLCAPLARPRCALHRNEARSCAQSASAADLCPTACVTAGADAPCIQEAVKLLTKYLLACGEASAIVDSPPASLLEGWAFVITSVLPEVSSCSLAACSCLHL